jgi:hypothetical protein
MAVRWKGPVVAKFGIDEYFRFLESVGGQGWYVVNLFGEYGREIDSADLSAGSGTLAAYLRKGGKRILRWELGNELDRGAYFWPSAKYTAIARSAAEAITHSDPGARFVATMQDYSSHWRYGIEASEFNRHVATSLRGIVSEFAQHSYYDGANNEVPFTVADRIANLCRTLATAQQAVRPGTAAGIWVTEHARQPVKTSKDAEWRPTWYKGSTLEAAVGVADFVIASAQIPEVHGLFVHALHGLDAPWPMFHRMKGRSQLAPSAVYWGLRVLRETMEPYVLPTVSSSANLSRYRGGYDVRGVVMTNGQRNRWSLWAVNRFSSEVKSMLQIPELAGKRATVSGSVLSDSDLNANNYVQGTRLRPRSLAFDIEFDSAGRAIVALPGNAVLGIRIEPGGNF